MPYHLDTCPSKFQMYVSNYFVDTMFHTFMNMLDLYFWARSSNLPSDAPLNLTTSGLEMVFPGMVQLYGPDVPVDMKVTLLQAENFDSA